MRGTSSGSASRPARSLCRLGLGVPSHSIHVPSSSTKARTSILPVSRTNDIRQPVCSLPVTCTHSSRRMQYRSSSFNQPRTTQCHKRRRTRRVGGGGSCPPPPILAKYITFVSISIPASSRVTTLGTGSSSGVDLFQGPIL